MPFVDWIGPFLQRPFPEEFPEGSVEHEVLTALRDGWDVTDTAELLKGLSERYGHPAKVAVGRLVEVNVGRDLAALGAQEAGEGTELDDYVERLWEPLRAVGFEFSSVGDANERTFFVTQCPVRDAAAVTGTTSWMYLLSCATDAPSATSFSPHIRFSRTMTLMQGAPCCDHHYLRVPPA